MQPSHANMERRQWSLDLQLLEVTGPASEGACGHRGHATDGELVEGGSARLRYASAGHVTISMARTAQKEG